MQQWYRKQLLRRDPRSLSQQCPHFPSLQNGLGSHRFNRVFQQWNSFSLLQQYVPTMTLHHMRCIVLEKTRQTDMDGHKGCSFTLERDEHLTRSQMSTVYSDIQKSFFTLHNLGRCCTNVILESLLRLGRSCSNVITGHCGLLEHSCTVTPNNLRNNVFQMLLDHYCSFILGPNGS
jgi:hypothetical protein